VTGLLLTLVLHGPLPDAETPNPFLQQAKDLYEGLDFEKCMQRVKQASSWKGSSVKDLRDIELYGALCALNLGNREEAAERFKLALRIDEDLELPEFASPKAVKLFLYVKRKLRQPNIPPMPDEDLPDNGKPPVEKHTEPVKTVKQVAAPPVAVVDTGPSPVAKHTGSILLGAGAVVLGGIGIGLGVHAKGLESQARMQTFESDYLLYRAQAQTSAIAANVMFVFTALAAITALVVMLTR
jgi:hypothetical protein